MALAFRSTFPGTPLGVRMLRREISVIAEDCGMDAKGRADVRLAVTEAATNAVVHAYEKQSGGLNVSADFSAGELSIVIADTGQGMAAGRDGSGFGLGLPLIASVASRFNIRSRPDGTEVHMAFECPPRASSA